MTKVIRMLLKEKIRVWQMFVSYLPGIVGDKLRYLYWKRRLRYLGKNVKIDVGVYFQNPEFISIDDNCWIDRGVIILAGPDRSERERRYIPNPRFQLERGMIHIGKNVHIGSGSIISGIGGVYISDNCGVSSGVKVFSFSHHYRSSKEPWNNEFIFSPLVPHPSQYMIEGPIFMGENVGVALNAILLPGVAIERDSFVMINSVVKTSFDENTLIEGNPARRIGDRFSIRDRQVDE